MGVDLSQLPAPEVIETLSFEAVLAEAKADFISKNPEFSDVIEIESEPVVKLLEHFAYRELVLRARYNAEAKALLLAYAEDADLDHIGATYYDGEQRLLVTPANPSAVPPVAAVYESNADYRYRLSLKPESFSVAGPRDAYEFHALSASGQVKSARPTSPESGSACIYILSRTGTGVPDASLLATVEAALSAEDIRPMSEDVVVSPATVIPYSISVALTMFPGPSGEVATAQASGNLTAFAADHHKLDADIIRSAIDAQAHVAGVKKVVIESPVTDIVCGPGEAPYCIGIAVRIAGVEP